MINHRKPPGDIQIIFYEIWHEKFIKVLYCNFIKATTECRLHIVRIDICIFFSDFINYEAYKKRRAREVY